MIRFRLRPRSTRSTRSTPRRLVAVTASALLTLGAFGAAVAPAQAATAVPTGLTVAVTGTTTLSVSWKAVPGAPRYRVAYSTASSMSGATYKRVTAAKLGLTGLAPGQAYYVKVRVITADGGNLSKYSPAVKATTTSTATSGSGPSAGSPMRVGSFNVKCFNCLGDHPEERSWWDRRADVVRDVRSQNLAVLGIQEASQAWLPAQQGGKGQDLSQFEDLRNRLGGSWRLTNANRNNCVKAKTPTKCVYKDQGASKGTRILYDASLVTLLDQGSKLLPSPEDDRFMAWATFVQRSTGKKFFFATAHLEPDKDWKLHVQEATVLAKEVAKQNTGHLPTFITGDMNAHKNSLNPSGVKDNPVYDVIVDQYGYVDPLGNRSGSTTGTPGATVEKRINTPLGSFNDFMPTPSPNYFGRRPNGTYIDYIFTSKKIRVLEWENVAHLDSKHAYVGKQASDHNLQRATVVLP